MLIAVTQMLEDGVRESGLRTRCITRIVSIVNLDGHGSTRRAARRRVFRYELTAKIDPRIKGLSRDYWTQSSFSKISLHYYPCIELFVTGTMVVDPARTARNDATAELYGLVLAGGASRRMGTDKGQLMYSGEPQVIVALRLVQYFASNAYVSLDRDREEYAGLPIIKDVNPDSGPAGALLSAWERHPDVAWLSVAVDMPLLNQQTLTVLVGSRDAAKIATAFTHSRGIVEPLCTIWEPAANSAVREEFEQRRGSLRRVLEASDVRLIEAPEPSRLESVDDPSRYRAVSTRFATDLSDQESDQ